MNVFISWSGETSRAVAQALRDWLPSVIQVLHPWMSDEDLKKGARWSSALAERLEKTDVGISCLTPDNLNAPWLHFEAGALAKRVQAAYVCPYLFLVEPGDLVGPFRDFQATKAEREDTRKLLKTVNDALGEGKLPEPQLVRAFDKWWPELEKSLSEIVPREGQQPVQRTQPEILAEVLALILGFFG